ncbi:hypothetical protein JCM19240_1314 [Vibrio maritimus]|uniref:Uncharacterized protein n=1 Tax=Vibrio maritimus TaxID=990268 RepID=A0A090T366_9VIBR|nr:hypothetical protein JCM19240_1314 [Vibrio maritimus]
MLCDYLKGFNGRLERVYANTFLSGLRQASMKSLIDKCFGRKLLT